MVNSTFFFCPLETWQLWAILSPEISFVKVAAAPLPPDPFFFFCQVEKFHNIKEKPEPNTMISCPKVDSGPTIMCSSGVWSNLHCMRLGQTQKVAPKGCSPSSRANALLLALPTKARILCLDSL
jgi:hypothetical protein